ncbi:hypothetical protein [Micromonospora haikouensis]|uniref:Uncharacterized protein n=1 Tax=Micromonospora haikouensis TaxID=686309 RepID=A0A0D0X622_9ACTN|nr:hypothetical protein [Micromonospora haikouensis]KIR64950.1 hypothetical protein TK50_05245 [Micromonospora haikouensis]
MRDADTPPQEPTDDRPHPVTLTPQQCADLIRAAAAEVRERVQEWRDSPNWRNTPTNSHRYETTVGAIDALGQLRDPNTEEAVASLADAVRPVIVEWRPSRPGPEQSIYAAVERLRRTIDTST